METAIADFVRTSSAFLIRHAISRLPPLIVVDAIANADGLVPLSVAAKDLRIRIPALPQPGPPVSRPISIRVYAQLPPPGEYQVFSYTVLPAYPVGDIEVVVPRRFVGNEGEYWLTYTVDDGDNVLRATTSTLLRVHKTPPFGYLSITPPRPLLPANLATPLITDEYLANNDPVWFRIPEHEQINDKKNVRAVFYYGNTNIHLAVPYTPPVTLSDVPAERMIPVPAAIIRARGNGTQQLTYRLIDQGGNRARDSLSLEITVAIRVTPSNIAMPRIPLAIAPDNTVTQWDINQSGQPGVDVWLDNASLQIGDTVAVTLAGTVVTASLTYAGQPLPLPFTVSTGQILATLPGAANTDTSAQVGFRVTSRGVAFNGPVRTLTFNLSALMTLAPPVVQNLNPDGNLNCNSALPLGATYSNRFIQVSIPASTLLIAGRSLTVTCALSRQDDGSNVIVPAVTVSVVLSADAPTRGLIVDVPYSTTMGVIGRGVMYVSYSTLNSANQQIRSTPVPVRVRGVLPGNVYCDGTPFIPTP